MSPKNLQKEIDDNWEKATKERESTNQQVKRVFNEHKENNIDENGETVLPDLKRFDITDKKFDLFWLIVGKRRYGKSTYAYNQIAKFFYMFPNGGYCFTGTKQNKFWSRIFPENRIYDKLDPDTVLKILEDQKAIYEKFANTDPSDPNIQKEIPFTLLVIDDQADDTILKYGEIVAKMAFTGRHYFLMTIFCLQDPKVIAPAVRQNADVISSKFIVFSNQFALC